MGSSYKEMTNEYKDTKKRLVDGYEDTPHKKSSKKIKKKRSDHKHIYIPAVYHFYYIDFKGEEHLQTSFGFHCYICGRIKDFYYNWSASSSQLENFKLEYPYYTEITLPKDWDIYKNIPV